MQAVLSTLLCISLLLDPVQSARWKKKKLSYSGSELVFLGKFCYDYDKKGDLVGVVEATLTVSNAGEAQGAGLELYFFDDEDQSWPTIHHVPNTTCQDWRAAAKSVSNVYFGEDNTFQFKRQILQGVRPRFWYLMMGSCYPMSTLTYSWEVHMTQLQHSDWEKEFGMNEMNLNTVFLIFFGMYVVLLLLQGYAVWSFKASNDFIHPLIRGLTLVVIFEFFYCLFKAIHFCTYADDGVGVPFLNKAGDVIEVFPRCLFILLLLLLATGWTISTDNIRGKWLIVSTVFVLFVFFVVGLVWNFVSYEPADVEILPELKSYGLALGSCWLALGFVFCLTCYFSWKKEDNPLKSNLYFRLGMLYSVWFTGLPFVFLLSYALLPWVREKIVSIFSLSVTLLGVCFMMFLLWPSRAEDYFSVDHRAVGATTVAAWERL